MLRLPIWRSGLEAVSLWAPLHIITSPQCWLQAQILCGSGWAGRSPTSLMGHSGSLWPSQLGSERMLMLRSESHWGTWKWRLKVYVCLDHWKCPGLSNTQFTLLRSTLDTSHNFSGLINGSLVLHWDTQAGRKSRGPITCEQTARACTSTEGGGHGAEKTHVKSFCTALLALRKLNLSLFTELYTYMSCNYNHTTQTTFRRLWKKI